MDYKVERFELAAKEIFGSDFCDQDIYKLVKLNGEYDSMLELQVANLVDPDRAGEICAKFSALLEKADSFSSNSGKIAKADGTFLVYFVFDNVRPFDLEQRLALFCYELDLEPEPVSVSAMRNLDSKYNIHLQK